MFPSDLRHFKPTEFSYPDKMNVSFLRWLDRVREEAGVPMIITDDFRPPNVMPEGASQTSLHFRGRAVDIRSHTWSATQRWDVTQAIVTLADEAPGRVEFEIVYSTTDQHFHLGADEKAVNHELILATE